MTFNWKFWQRTPKKSTESVTTPGPLTPLQIRKLWTAALRSGQYRKGTGRLKRLDGSYCCLGVLCELAVAHGIIRPPRLDGDCYTYDPDNKWAVLPTIVANWAGLSPANPVVYYISPYSGVSQRHDLAFINDLSLIHI